MNEWEGKKKERGREANHKRLLMIEIEGWWREEDGVWAKWLMGIKEGTCDEHWVLYVNDESLNSASETSIMPYDN